MLCFLDLINWYFIFRHDCITQVKLLKSTKCVWYKVLPTMNVELLLQSLDCLCVRTHSIYVLRKYVGLNALSLINLLLFDLLIVIILWRRRWSFFVISWWIWIVESFTYTWFSRWSFLCFFNFRLCNFTLVNLLFSVLVYKYTNYESLTLLQWILNVLILSNIILRFVWGFDLLLLLAWTRTSILIYSIFRVDLLWSMRRWLVELKLICVWLRCC